MDEIYYMRNIFVILKNIFTQNFYVSERLFLYELCSPLSIVSDAKIEKATDTSISDVVCFQNKDMVGIYRNLLKNGDTGYQAYLGEKCVHVSFTRPYTKETNKAFPHSGYTYFLKENEVYVHYCETAPDARGKNVYPYVLTKIAEEYPNKTLVLFIYKDNWASIKGVEKAGFRKRCTLHVLILLGLKFTRMINDK